MNVRRDTPAKSPDIILVWPKGREAPAYAPVEGYSVAPLGPAEDDTWVSIHRSAVPSFPDSALREWLARYRGLAVDDGILVAREQESGAPVATAGSLSHSKDGMFPHGGQLGWVATVPDHRGRGLATWLSGAATARLLADGFEHIFLCTGDDMVPALRVYLGLGYVPCLYAPDQRARWEAIARSVPRCRERGLWITLDDYVAGFGDNTTSGGTQ